MSLEDFLLLATTALAFSACSVALVRRFFGAARWRAPFLTEPW